MVNVYTGTPGSGKSLHSARSILRMLNTGCRVISNFPINLGMIKPKYRNKFFYVPDKDLKPRYLFEFAKKYHIEGKEDQTYIFIDEAQRIFPIDRVYELRKDWEQFFQLHRHFGFSVVLVTQNLSYINKGIRIQTEYEIKHRKCNNYGFGGLLLSAFHIPLFVAITYWQGTKDRIFSDFFLYHKKYSKLYNSFGNFDTLFSFDDIVLEEPESVEEDLEEVDQEDLEEIDAGSSEFDEENIESWDNELYISDKELELWKVS